MAIASAYSRRPTHAHVARVRSPLAAIASFLARFAFVLLTASVVTRWLGVVGLEELLAPALLTTAAVAGAVLAAVLALLDAWFRGSKGAWQAIRALMLAALVALPLALAAQRVASSTAMPDVSTDPLDPPRIADLVLPADNAVGAVPELATRRYDATIERVATAVASAIDDLGWVVDTTSLRPSEVEEPVIAQPPEPDAPVIPIPRMRPLTAGEQAVRDARLEADREALAEARREEEAVLLVSGELVSPVLGVRSDVAIRLRDDGDATSVDIRLRTREGTRDLGENARRAAAFLDALDRASGRAGIR